MFQLARYAFNKNHESLQRSIEAMKPGGEPDDYTVFEFGDKVEPGILEVCRCWQNFIISAKTLVDQSRALYASLYKKDGKLAEYPAEIERRFAENELHHFIQCSRNMIAHERVPIVAYTEKRCMGLGKPTVVYQVHFRKDELLKYYKWNVQAKSFLSRSGSMVDIAAISRDYHRQVDEFHTWFEQKQREAHKEELGHLESLEAQLRQLAADIRQNHREKFADLSTEQTEPPAAGRPAENLRIESAVWQPNKRYQTPTVLATTAAPRRFRNARDSWRQLSISLPARPASSAHAPSHAKTGCLLYMPAS